MNVNPSQQCPSSHRAASGRIIRASGTFNFNGVVQLNHCCAQIGASLSGRFHDFNRLVAIPNPDGLKTINDTFRQVPFSRQRHLMRRWLLLSGLILFFNCRAKIWQPEKVNITWIVHVGRYVRMWMSTLACMLMYLCNVMECNVNGM